MFIVSLSNDWDVTVAEWQVETEKEAENLKAYIEQKIKKLGLEYKYYGGCEIYEPMEGNNKEVDEYFDEVLTEIEEEIAERKKREDKERAEPSVINLSNLDLSSVDFSNMFKECKK